MGNAKGLYATMIGGRIDPSSCLDTCWVDDMAVWWFRATCFHGLKYLCVNREVLKDNCIIHMVDGKRYTQSCPMGDIEPELNPNIFKRIHRSFIVNISYIDMYYYGHVVLENGMEVHIAIAKHITSGSASDYFYADDINGVHRKFFRLDENMYDHVKGSTKGKMYFYYALGHLTDNAVVEMKFCGKGDRTVKTSTGKCGVLYRWVFSQGCVGRIQIQQEQCGSYPTVTPQLPHS